MTIREAIDAMQTQCRVQAGQGEDHDIGRIHKIDGDMAIVGWNSGVVTPCPISDLWPLARPQPERNLP